MPYGSSPRHVTPLPPGLPASMHLHEMWQNHEHNIRRGYDAREVHTSYQTPPPPPLRRMSGLSNFSDESATTSRANAKGTTFDNAIDAEEQNANISLTTASKAPSVEDALPDAEHEV